jgi:hypothetical protein
MNVRLLYVLSTTSSRSTPSVPRRNSPASVRLPCNSDTRLDGRLLPFEPRPLLPYKTGSVVALECRANFCTPDTGSRLVQCRNAAPVEDCPEMQLCDPAQPV